jgi:hypothetical protein
VALATAPRPNAALSGSVVPFRARKADKRTAHEDAYMEVLAFADEVVAAVERFGMAISGQSWTATHSEAQRLGGRALAFRTEYLRLTGGNDAA